MILIDQFHECFSQLYLFSMNDLHEDDLIPDVQFPHFAILKFLNSSL